MKGRRTTCRVCGELLEHKAQGRPRQYCSGACRTAHQRQEEQYYLRDTIFDYHWGELLRKERFEHFAPETLEIIKHVTKYNGAYVGGLVVKAIRTEVKAREQARPKREKKSQEATIESTVIYPDL